MNHKYLYGRPQRVLWLSQDLVMRHEWVKSVELASCMTHPLDLMLGKIMKFLLYSDGIWIWVIWKWQLYFSRWSELPWEGCYSLVHNPLKVRSVFLTLFYLGHYLHRKLPYGFQHGFPSCVTCYRRLCKHVLWVSQMARRSIAIWPYRRNLPSAGWNPRRRMVCLRKVMTFLYD